DHLLESPAVEARLDRHDEDLERHRLDTPERAARIRRLPVADERTRWDCHGCGMCCKGLSVPLRPDEIARIDPALYEDVLAGRSFHVPFVATGGDDIERVLRQVGRDERCVFLAQD